MVLNYVTNRQHGEFLTVTSMYPKHGSLDGETIGRYISSYKFDHK